MMRDESVPSMFFGTVLVASEDFDEVELFIHTQVATYDEGSGATHDQPFFLSSGDRILFRFVYEKGV